MFFQRQCQTLAPLYLGCNISLVLFPLRMQRILAVGCIGTFCFIETQKGGGLRSATLTTAETLTWAAKRSR